MTLPKTDGTELASCRNIADMPRTKAGALLLLSRLAYHFKHSGQAGFQRFDSPYESHQLVVKLRDQVFAKWRRRVNEPRKHIFRRRHLRHRLSQRKLQVVKTDTAPMLRAALPKIHMQGFLRKRVAVFPYRPMDTFLATHRVNVFKNNGRFDVIDALCNIPILTGITRKAMREVVEW